MKLLRLINLKSGTEGSENKVSFLQITPKLDHTTDDTQIK